MADDRSYDLGTYGLTAENLLRTFPEVLRDGGTLSALGETIAAALEERSRETIAASLWPRIGELSGEILDLLAAELRTPFYDPSYEIEARRDLIRQTMPYYRSIGTRGAVQRMLRSVFPGSRVEEWMDYGGDPLRFRVVVELARARGAADAVRIRREIDRCKRDAAHLETILFQWDTGLTIGTSARGYPYRVPLTGPTVCGTWPGRSTRARLDRAAITAGTASGAYRYRAPLTGPTVTGTVPGRAIRAETADGGPSVDTRTEAWSYHVPQTGTVPGRAVRDGTGHGASSVTADSAAFHYSVPRCGTRLCRS